MSAGGPFVDHGVQVFIDQFLDLGPHRFGAPEGELAGHHAPQPMMLGIVDTCENRRRLAVARLPEQVREGFRRQPRVDQRSSDVLVAAHRPDLLTVPHRSPQAVLVSPAGEFRWRMKGTVCGPLGRYDRKIGLGARIGSC
jgi:hypothetical protein